jgi:acyl-CoA synthetase (AMP-forming)/AMP-acid ligase II
MEAESAREHQKSGFQALLGQIAERIVPGTALGDALSDILTLGGRQPLAFGAQSLTAVQRAVMDEASAMPLHDPDDGIDREGDCTWYLGQWSYGRVWLARERPADGECRLLGALSMSSAMFDAVVRRAARTLDAWHACDGEMNAFFDALDARGVQRVLDAVHEAIDQTDPVLLYIGEATLTNVGKFNNLQERAADLPHCFHRRAQDVAPDRWTWAEKVYVFCMHWLRTAGCRGEEFCGRQLNPALLRDYLDERIAQYRTWAPQVYDIDTPTIADRARLLARCKAERADDLLTYRTINGLTFHKEELLCSRHRLPGGAESMPPFLRAQIAAICGVEVSRHDSLSSLFDACVAQLARNGFASNDPKLNAIERLLKAIVDAAIDATGSDAGMTRGTRDVARMQRAFAEERYAEICAWPAADYFCAVFPSRGLQEKLRDRPDLLVKILYACSGRMQFNHWHYMPGHCPRADVPADRHFYMPPRMPDIAAWTDQHHAGHVLAEVRYSIRSPAPLAFNGKVYPGMVDLRLFRQSGEPYTDDDLVVALTYTEYVRALHQSVSNHLARGGEPVCVTAFDKDWYRDYYGAAQTATADDAQASAPDALPAAVALTPPSTELFRLLHARAGSGGIAFIEASQSCSDTSMNDTSANDVPMDYRALTAHALALRAAMQAGGVPSGACVALLSRRPLHQAIAIVVGIANGLIVNPLNPALSQEVLRAQLHHGQPVWLITDGSVPALQDVPRRVRCVEWNELFGTAKDIDPAAFPCTPAGTDDTGGLLIYTSGTTGTSKGVLLNWPHIAANVRHAIGALGFTPGWIAGSLLPRFHTFTLISDVFPPLLLGGTVVLVDTFDLRNVKRTVDAFRRYGVQSYSAAPIILEALCGLNAWADAPAMCFAVAGAAPLKESTRLAYARAFGHPIIPCYGLTETTCFATISPRDAIRPGSAGKPAGIAIRVVDEHGVVRDEGATGELEMRGPSVISDGYFRDEAARFAKAFTGDGWFKTGDIGRIDEDGYVYVTGRKKNMVIRGGEKIYLEDVDRCLADYLGVLDCTSIVVCEPQQPDLALTFIVTSGAPIPREDIAAHVRSALTAQHVPDRIYFVDHIPRTPSGKASHPELQALSRAMRLCGEIA